MLTYLALGDSYTIGEQVDLLATFPYQTLALLRAQNVALAAPEIVAKTGWTSSELLDAMGKYTFLPSYNLVTLLIGVNNQYRGEEVRIYEQTFTSLLQQAIALAANKPTKVFVLSIPDWGITPFAADKNKVQIAADIDAYNSICKKITVSHQCQFINITTVQRNTNHDDEMLASDGLHPSGKQYTLWAEQLVAAITLPHFA